MSSSRTRSAPPTPTPTAPASSESTASRSGGSSSVGLATITITCEETFPSSSPNEIAHILQLRFTFDNGSASCGARNLHIQGQRRRTAHQPARLLEHGHDEARQGGRRRLAPRCPAAAPSSSADPAASGSRSPRFSPRRAQASWSTDVTPTRRQRRRDASTARSRTRLTVRSGDRRRADRQVHKRIRPNRHPGELRGHRRDWPANRS